MSIEALSIYTSHILKSRNVSVKILKLVFVDDFIANLENVAHNTATEYFQGCKHYKISILKQEITYCPKWSKMLLRNVFANGSITLVLVRDKHFHHREPLLLLESMHYGYDNSLVYSNLKIFGFQCWSWGYVFQGNVPTYLILNLFLVMLELAALLTVKEFFTDNTFKNYFAHSFQNWCFAFIVSKVVTFLKASLSCLVTNRKRCFHR